MSNTKWKVVGRSYGKKNRVLFHLRRVFYTAKGVVGAENRRAYRYELDKFGVVI